MEKYVKQSIDARKKAIFDAYEVGEGEKKKVEAVFAEIEKLGESCKDAGEFEAEFSKSPLNQKYLDLFTEVAKTGKAKVAAPKVDKAGTLKTVAAGTAAGIAESAADQAINNVVPTRAAVHQEVSDAARKVPVLGDAIDIGQKASYLGHLGKLFGGKKKK
ncbi:hypothetical protein IKF28_02820 [Candidatus Saccharibacteria bacterium]|nr:hypothetical protein [Candidatus Saccharibacteria bacterium]